VPQRSQRLLNRSWLDCFIHDFNFMHNFYFEHAMDYPVLTLVLGLIRRQSNEKGKEKGLGVQGL
jgi:hypothetical protein